MLPRLFHLLLLFSLGAPAMAQEVPSIAPRPLQSALEAVRAERWENAAGLAARAGPAAESLIEWIRLREGFGSSAEVLTFLKTHSKWPGLDRLRRENEEVMTGAEFDDVLTFYEDYTPQTGTGALNMAEALLSRGQIGDAEANLVLAWRTLDLTTEEHNNFIERHAELLSPHHEARLQMALWRGLRDVTQMLPLVDKDTRALAQIRQRIEKGETISDTSLPEGGLEDPGIAYARFNQHVQKGRDTEAIALIIERSQIEDGLGEPSRWAGWRRFLARAQMRAGEPETAYRIASVHGLIEGSAYADLEWLSGYLSLTYLNDPNQALEHFQRFREAVFTPISLGRAGYWIGRAHDAKGDTEAAISAYLFGAEYQTSFYGLLAAERAGVEPDPSLSGDPSGEAWRTADFTDHTLFKAGVLALRAGQLSLAEQLFVALSDTLPPEGLSALGQALDHLDAAHVQVMVGKAAAKRGLVIPGPYYALHSMRNMELPVPMELALAIARRESEFDPNVVSGAGAQGLMQLMPGTASDVARDLGITHERDKVLSDWEYNATLGSAYLVQMAQRFDGNIIMLAAGYNAGPGRPIRWMETYGDPRGNPDRIVDWIEHIPFRETRNYVMRVAESLPVYRARLGKTIMPIPFSEEIAGDTLRVD